MTHRTLSQRALNRATLARQLLLERAHLPIQEAITQLGGLQAQVNNPPYIGLWTRLRDFRRHDLTALMERRQVVRTAAMRSTLHLWTADDFLRLRTAIEPALAKGLYSFFGRDIRELDIPLITREARSFLAQAPRTQLEQRKHLAQFAPDRPPEALAYIARTYLPLLQTYPGGVWGTGGSPPYALDVQYLGRAVDAADNLRALMHAYLGAFGPATVADAATWAGIPRLKEAIAGFKHNFAIYRDMRGRELLDVPDMPLPAEDTPVPVRFMPEYDNLLIGHDDRTRVIADEFRKRVFLSAGRVRATFLIDGFVRGAWRIEKLKQQATLVIETFSPLAGYEEAPLLDEGERLLRWVDDTAAGYDVRIETP